MSTIQPTDGKEVQVSYADEMNAIAEAEAAEANAKSLPHNTRGDKGVEIMEKAASVEGPEVQMAPQAPEPEEPTAAPQNQGSEDRSTQVQGRAPNPICPTCHKRHHPPHIDNYNGQQPHRRGRNRRHRGGFVRVSLANASPEAARAFAEGLRRERSRSPAQTRRRDYRERSDR